MMWSVIAVKFWVARETHDGLIENISAQWPTVAERSKDQLHCDVVVTSTSA